MELVAKAQAQAGGRSILALLVATVLISLTAMTMLGPLLVELAREFGTSVAVAGQLISASTLGWFICGAIGGLAISIGGYAYLGLLCLTMGLLAAGTYRFMVAEMAADGA